MSELSLQELDAQFSELLPEREALGCINFSLPCHDVPCHPHHHHCKPEPCKPKPCPPHHERPCPPPHKQPCDDDSLKYSNGHSNDHRGNYGHNQNNTPPAKTPVGGTPPIKTP
jgi:hypothetical protein